MRRGTWILVAGAVATVPGILRGLDAWSADDSPKPAPPVPAYNPYPPRILPSDLEAEIDRVRREVRVIFNEYRTQWRGLTPPTAIGNPHALQGTGYQGMQILGG